MVSYNDIQNNAASEASAGDWDAVAKIMNAKTIRVHDTTQRSAKQTFVALMTAGISPDAVLSGMKSSPTGEGFLQVLYVHGIDWGDTVSQILLASLPPEVASVLTAMNVTYMSIAGVDVTSDECKTAWNSATLETDWITQQNFGGLKEAIASGDRAALASALRLSADTIEGK